MSAFNANRMKVWLLCCVNKINAYVTFSGRLNRLLELFGDKT